MGNKHTAARCEAREAECVCNLGENHQGPHECDCEGSWYFDVKGRFVPVRFPFGIKVTIDND